MSEKLSENQKIEIIKNSVKKYPDFPKPGVIFRDIFSIFIQPQLLETVHQLLLSHVRKIQPSVECICGVDSKGFLFGPMIALDLKVPFVPIRKKGKLPGTVQKVTYDLEYGQDTIEIQKDSIKEGSRVLIVDDVLATGGTLAAAAELVRELNAQVVECLIVIELTYLNGRSKMHHPVHSIVQY